MGLSIYNYNALKEVLANKEDRYKITKFIHQHQKKKTKNAWKII